MNRILFFSFFFFFCLSTAFAQSIPMRHYTADDGLVQNDVYTGFQDRQGYLWFGTYSGLSRFDGKHFKNFNKENSGIGGSVIKSIVEDSSGKIWVAYSGGISRLEGDTFINITEKHGLLGNDFLSLWPDFKSGVWAVSDLGVSYYNDGKVISYPLDSIDPFSFSAISGSHSGEVFVASSKGLYVGSSKSKKFSLSEKVRFPIKTLRYRQQEKALYMASGKALYRLKDNQLEKIADSPLQDDIIHFSFDEHQTVWLASEAEVWKWSPGKQRIYSSQSLQKVSITGIFTDREGNLWLTRWGGVSMVLNHQILNFHDCLQGKTVTQIERDSNDLLWVSGEKGMVAFDEYGKVQMRIPTNYINGFVIDDDRLLLATDTNGIKAYNLNGKHLYNIETGKGFTRIHKDTNGKLWVGSYSGLYLLNGQELQLEMTTAKGMGSNNVWSIIEDRAQSLWVGTENGISRLKQGKWSHFDRKSGLLSTTIWSLLDHPEWGMLVGTDQGLHQFNDNRFVPFEFTSSKSQTETLKRLRWMGIYYLNMDHFHNLWVGGKYGLYRINRKKELDLFLDKSSGLPTDSIYTGGGNFKDRHYIYAGTYGGLARIETGISVPKRVTPKLVINSVEVNQKTKSLSVLDQPLAYEKRNLTFNFSAIYMSNPSKVKYRFQLKGLESVMGPPRTINRAVYTNLPFGKYTFHVQAFADNGRKSEIRTIELKILKPFWFQWWFLLLAFIAINIFTAFVFRFYKNKKLREIHEERESIKVQNVFLEVKVEEATSKLRESNKRLQEDLAIATSFQRATLPPLPRLDYVEIDTIYLPYNGGVSGDVYDFTVNREKELTVFIGDATGHGIAAAFMTMMVQIGLDSLPGHATVVEAMNSLNAALTSRELEKFMTAVYLKITQDGHLEVADAGHPPVIILPADGTEVVQLKGDGLPLGMFADVPVPYVSNNYQLQTGDKIFIYSDGIYEWPNTQEEQFGLEGLIESLEKRREFPLSGILNGLLEDIKGFSKGNECDDDFTMVGLVFKGVDG